MHCSLRNFVSFCRILCVACRRPLADEGNPHFKERVLGVRGLQTSYVTNEGPNPVLIFNMIENPQLPRHRNRHMQQSPCFSRSFQCKTRAEGRYIYQPGNFCPLKIGSFATVHSDRELQFQSFADPLLHYLLVSHGGGSRKTPSRRSVKYKIPTRNYGQS